MDESRSQEAVSSALADKDNRTSSTPRRGTRVTRHTSRKWAGASRVGDGRI